MSTSQITAVLNSAKSLGRVNAEDMRAIRQAIYKDHAFTANEADVLFAFNDFKDKPADWSRFFVEIMTEFLVYEMPPKGSVNPINASWLLARINHDGVVDSETELQLLINVLRRSDNAPDELEEFALAQVKKAVLDGVGHYGEIRTDARGVIIESDVNMLRTILYASASEGGMGISRLEAEALFDLNDATANSTNHESWQKFFVGAIANHFDGSGGL